MNLLRQLGMGWLRLTSTHPLLTLLGCSVFLIAGFSGIGNFKLDASTDALLLENDPALRQYREAVTDYGFGSFLIVAWEDEEGIFNRPTVDNLSALVADIKAVDGVESVLSLLDAVVLPEEKVPLGDIVDALRNLSDSDVDLGLAQRQLTASPVFRSLLTNPEGTLTAVVINLEPSVQGYNELVDERYRLRDLMEEGQGGAATRRRLQEINQGIASLNEQALARQQKRVAELRAVLAKHSDSARLFLGGPDMIIVDMVESIREDMLVFGIAAALLFLLVLTLFFRRVTWVLLPVGISLSVVFFMSGLLGWADWKVTVISSNFAALLMILAVSLSVHLVVRHRELCHKMSGSSAAELAVETCKQMFVPCLYAALTTLIAFGSLVVSGIQPVIEFGKMMGLGMCVALLLAFSLAPAALTLVGPPKKLSDKDWTRGVTNALAGLVERRGLWILSVALVLFALSALGVTRLKVDNRFIDYFKEDTEIYQGMLRLDEKLGGTVPFDVILRAPNREELHRPAEDAFAGDLNNDLDDDLADLDFLSDLDEALGGGDENAGKGGFWYNDFGLSRLRQVHRALEAEEGVGKVLSLGSMLDLAEEMKGGEPLSNLELAVMREYIPEDLAVSLFDPFLSVDGNEVRLQARVVESTPGLRRNDLINNLHKAIQAQGFSPEEYEIVGAAVLYNNMLQSLYQSQIQTLGLVFAIVGLMFLLLFRSFTIALLGLAPNLLAAGVVLGTLGLLGIPLDLVTVTVASISVGIAVDNAIHYLYRYRIEYGRSGDYRKAVAASHSTVGQGIYYTSFAIMAGFLVFVLSNFIPTVYFGIFTALAMLMASLGALTLLPRLIVLVKPFGKERTS